MLLAPLSVSVSAPTLVSRPVPLITPVSVMSPLPPMKLAVFSASVPLAVAAAPLLVSAPTVPPEPPTP